MADQEQAVQEGALCTECKTGAGAHAKTCSKYQPAQVPEPEQPSGEIEASSVIRPDPTKRQTGKAEPYAYTLTDRLFGEFAVLNSANGWWVDSGKVQALLQAYKIDCTDEEACAYAGISLDQLRYFAELHADFSRIKLACKQLPILRARKTVVESLEKSSAMATWYLERKRKEEFSARQEIAGPNGEEVISQTKRISKLIHDVELSLIHI